MWQTLVHNWHIITGSTRSFQNTTSSLLAIISLAARNMWLNENELSMLSELPENVWDLLVEFLTLALMEAVPYVCIIWHYRYTLLLTDLSLYFSVTVTLLDKVTPAFYLVIWYSVRETFDWFIDTFCPFSHLSVSAISLDAVCPLVGDFIITRTLFSVMSVGSHAR